MVKIGASCCAGISWKACGEMYLDGGSSDHFDRLGQLHLDNSLGQFGRLGRLYLGDLLEQW